MLSKKQTEKLQKEFNTIYADWTPSAKTVLNLLPENREITENQSNHIAKLISGSCLLQDPIVVATKAYNKKGDNNFHLYILDGQHRVTACKKLNMSFTYKIIRIDSQKKIVHLMGEVNNSGKPWNLDNYIHSFSLQSETAMDYIPLKNFTKKYSNYTSSIVANLLHYGNLNSRKSEMVKFGDFNFTYSEKAVEALTIFDLVSIHMANKSDKNVKIALRSVNFRAALLDFIKDNKETIDITKFIKGFADNLIAVKDLPSNSTEWRSAMNKYHLSTL